MGQNKTISSETKPKKDKFFKKPNQYKLQKHNFDQRNNLASDYKATNNFFIKKVDQTEIAPTKSDKPKKSENPRKPFDKKKWRLQKYSKKYKLQQWEEIRKKVILREYYKQNKEDDTAKMNVQKIYDEAEGQDENSNPKRGDELENENNLNSEITNENLESTQQVPAGNKRKLHLNAYDEYQRLKQEKRQRKEEIQKKREERDKALKEYKKEKARKFKKLNRKTSKGQPLMKYRMQMLLEQIQKTTPE